MRLDNLVDALFTNNIRPLRQGGRLRGLTYVMLASQLMYMEQFKKMFGPHRSVIVKLVTTGRQYGFSKTELLEYGNQIKKVWIVKCKGAHKKVQDCDDQVGMNTSAISSLTDITISLLSRLNHHTVEQDSMMGTLSKIMTKLDAIESNCVMQVENVTSKSRHLKRKACDDED